MVLHNAMFLVGAALVHENQSRASAWWYGAQNDVNCDLSLLRLADAHSALNQLTND